MLDQLSLYPFPRFYKQVRQNLKRSILLATLSAGALTPQIGSACISTPAGVQSILPNTSEVPANALFYVDFIGGVEFILDGLSATVNGETVSIELTEVSEVSGTFFTLNPSPIEGDEVVITGLQGHDPSNLAEATVDEISVSLSVTAPYQGAEEPMFAVSRVIKDRNDPTISIGSCDGDVSEDLTRERTDVLHVLVPSDDLSTGFLVQDGAVRPRFGREEVEIDGISYARLSLLIERQYFEDLGPAILEEPTCVDLAFLSPIGELSTTETYCTPCVYETIDLDDTVLERVVNSEACGHEDLSLIDEYASSGEVDADPSPNSGEGETGEIITEEGGCDQTHTHSTPSASWILLALLMGLMKRVTRQAFKV
ncbi:MAG: hypothetical protein CMH49_00060 [Myxococcales bacterium]|nr:hypothetical protein [Myxococcales bacterium]